MLIVCRACSGCWDWLEPVPTASRGECGGSPKPFFGSERHTLNCRSGGGSGMQRTGYIAQRVTGGPGGAIGPGSGARIIGSQIGVIPDPRTVSHPRPISAVVDLHCRSGVPRATSPQPEGPR